MCNGQSANNTINVCNGGDCAATYAPTHAQLYPEQPLGWTENEGWFQSWNIEPLTNADGDNRTPQDMANVIAKVFEAIQKLLVIHSQ